MAGTYQSPVPSILRQLVSQKKHVTYVYLGKPLKYYNLMRMCSGTVLNWCGRTLRSQNLMLFYHICRYSYVSDPILADTSFIFFFYHLMSYHIITKCTKEHPSLYPIPLATRDTGYYSKLEKGKNFSKNQPWGHHESFFLTRSWCFHLINGRSSISQEDQEGVPFYRVQHANCLGGFKFESKNWVTTFCCFDSKDDSDIVHHSHWQ